MTTIINRVRVLTSTTGTGTITLGDAYADNFLTEVEAGLADAQESIIVIEEGTDFEIVRGVYTASGRTFTRATVLNSKISGTAGTTKMTLAGAAVVRFIVAADFYNAVLRGDEAQSLTTAQQAQAAANLGFSKGADLGDSDIDVSNILTLGTDGNYFDLTGTQQIDEIATHAVGRYVKFHFDTARTLTHHATNLILPGGADIVTAAGDEAEFFEYATADWRCTNYTTASGISLVSKLKLGSPTTTTSGTAYNYTGLPSGLKKITMSFSGVSTNGSALPMIRIGDSGGLKTSGYLGSVANGAATSTSPNGFLLSNSFGAASVFNGIGIFSLLDASTDTWSWFGNFGFSNAASVAVSAGSVALSGDLDRIQLLTSTALDTYDAGKINIMYE